MKLVQARADTAALQNSVRYIDLDSTYRNRSDHPNSADFTVRSGVSQSHEPEDPILDELPVFTFLGSGTAMSVTPLSLSANNAMIGSTDTDLTGRRLTTISAAYPGSTTIISSHDMGASTITFLTPITPYSVIRVEINEPTGYNQVYAKLPPALYTSVVGMYLLTQEGFNWRIAAYDSTFNVITVDGVVPALANGEVRRYEIAKTPTRTFWVAPGGQGLVSSAAPGPADTSVTTDLAGVKPGMYLRFTGYTSPDLILTQPFDFTRRVTRVDGDTIHFTPTFGVPDPRDLIVQALAPPRDNCSRHNHSGACTPLAPGMYEIELKTLVLPNTTVRSTQGGCVNRYSHLYLEFGNVTPACGRTDSVFASNNPHTTRAVFKVHILDAQLPAKASFLKAASTMKHTVYLDPHGDLSFRLLLPTGEPLRWNTDDSVSPYAPNPALQVSATFCVRRAAV